MTPVVKETGVLYQASGAYALTTGIDRDRQRSAVVPIAVVDADLVFAVTPKVALIGETRAAGNVFTFLIKSDSLSTLRSVCSCPIATFEQLQRHSHDLAYQNVVAALQPVADEALAAGCERDLHGLVLGGDSGGQCTGPFNASGRTSPGRSLARASECRRCDQPLWSMSLKSSLRPPRTGPPEPIPAKSVDRGSS
jgi:hypothetical protein